MAIIAQEKKRLLHEMLRIRMVQERIESRYLNDEMKTPVHLYIGQEAIAVGVCSALNSNDYISSNHRSHGHYLAKGGDLNAMIAELHCKNTGCSKGYGGSMHLVDTDVGHLGSSAIVGGGIPIGTGLGLALQMKKSAAVSVVFFGDGAADEGVLYESINFAMLKKLPVIYVLENNQWSVCSHISQRHPGDNIFHGAADDLLYSRKVDGNDVLDVRDAAQHAISRAKNGEGPSLLECTTYRILGHAGCASQDAPGYRDQNDIAEWQKKCPVESLTNHLLTNNILAKIDINTMVDLIGVEIDKAFSFAESSPLPTEKDLLANIFCE